MRAEIRAGELLREMAERKERAKAGDPKSRPATLTTKLSDLGMTKTQSSRWRRLAAMSPEYFEKLLFRIKRKAADRMMMRRPAPASSTNAAREPALTAFRPSPWR